MNRRNLLKIAGTRTNTVHEACVLKIRLGKNCKNKKKKKKNILEFFYLDETRDETFSQRWIYPSLQF